MDPKGLLLQWPQPDREGKPRWSGGIGFPVSCGPYWIRTSDQRTKSRLLYPLSQRPGSSDIRPPPWHFARSP